MDMTEDEKKQEEKRTTQRWTRSTANAALSVGTTLAMTSTTASLGTVAAAACLAGAVIRETMLSEHAEGAYSSETNSEESSADKTQAVDGRSAVTRLTDAGYAIMPTLITSLAPLGKQVSKHAPGSLVVAAVVEAVQEAKGACDLYWKVTYIPLRIVI